MSVLSNFEIIEKIKSGDISFSPPLDSFQLQAHSVDLRLGFTFMIPKMWVLNKNGRESISLGSFENHGSNFFDIVELEKGQYFDILPQEHILVSSLESVKVPQDLMAILYPRSSTNRKGLSLDLTGIIDAGYEGQLTLPIKNNTKSQTIRLYPGERFCQIVFEELKQVVQARKSRYHKRDIIDGVAKEKKEEINYIIKGNLKELKEDHSI